MTDAPPLDETEPFSVAELVVTLEAAEVTTVGEMALAVNAAVLPVLLSVSVKVPPSVPVIRLQVAVPLLLTEQEFRLAPLPPLTLKSVASVKLPPVPVSSCHTQLPQVNDNDCCVLLTFPEVGEMLNVGVATVTEALAESVLSVIVAVPVDAVLTVKVAAVALVTDWLTLVAPETENTVAPDPLGTQAVFVPAAESGILPLWPEGIVLGVAVKLGEEPPTVIV